MQGHKSHQDTKCKGDQQGAQTRLRAVAKRRDAFYEAGAKGAFRRVFQRFLNARQ